MPIILFVFTIVVAGIVGYLVSKLKLPSILGWLITGMILGPHALGILNQEIIDAAWYQSVVHILECAVGLMIGTELVWKKIKVAGKSIIITTLTQSLRTFFVVSLVFGVVFYFSGIPLYLALIFGGIALATALAPALSIVKEFKARGPVTSTLIPMAALDDIVGCAVFFTTISIIAGTLSAGELPGYMISLIVLLPIIIGVLTGWVTGLVMKRLSDIKMCFFVMILGIILTVFLPSPILNFLLMGMAFSAVFSNMIGEKLEEIMKMFNPV